MESKVEEYQEMFEEFEQLHKQIACIEEPVNDIRNEINDLKNEQKKDDYNNPDVIVSYMESYVDKCIAKEKDEIQNDVNEKILKISEHNESSKKNFEKIVKWLSRTKVEKYLHSIEIDYEKNLDVSQNKKDHEFTILTMLNTVLAFVFRFDFLRFIPKFFRVITGAGVWALFLVPKITSKVYEKCLINYEEKISKMVQYDYEAMSNQFTQDVKNLSVSSIIIVAMLIIGFNIIIYILTRYFAKKSLEDNKEMFLYIINSNELKQKMYNAGVKNYMEHTVADWKKEIEVIKQNGVSENFEENSLAALVKNALYENYNLLEKNIETCNTKIEEIYGKTEQLRQKLQKIISKLKQKEKEVDSLVADSDHNDGVLSPYVSTGYSQYTIKGVKELIYFKHNYKPILICYDDETVKDGERFRKNASRLIELFMSGFFQENYHAYINMWLVDFEGLYFPESRTKGLMKVVHTQQGVQQIFEELKKTRDCVDSLDDGRISTINPIRLKNRENPIKYNIVFFIGYDFLNVDREMSQLFIGGENFGFLPIIFIGKSVAQAMLKDDVATKAFSRVVEKARNNGQVYEYEGLISEFEIDMMVSNQKQFINERLCVNKIMSMDDFIKIAYGEGLDVNKILYLDTYQLSKDLYEAVKDIDYVKLFTVNNEIPEFVSKEVIHL